MDKVLVIEGPTAIGKSSFAIEVAKIFDGEIISGDSVQVYRHFDIASGKVTKEEMQGIAHHLLDIRDYDEEYTINDFQKDVRYLIDDIKMRDKLPIIVGGSGLYLKSALYDYELKDEESKDEPYDELSNAELYARLKEVDPLILKKIHINNRRRLLRAYNYYMKNGEPMSEAIARQRHELLYDALIIGLTTDRQELYKRIDRRVDKMISDGAKEEVLDLIKMGCSFDDKPMCSIGYKEWKQYIEGKKSEKEVIDDIKKATRNLAKRQYTWFTHQTPIIWYDIKDTKHAIKKIEEWLDGQKIY